MNIILWTMKSLKSSSLQGTCRLDRVKTSDYPNRKNVYSKSQKVLMQNCVFSAIQTQSGKPKSWPTYRFPPKQSVYPCHTTRVRNLGKNQIHKSLVTYLPVTIAFKVVILFVLDVFAPSVITVASYVKNF